MCPKHESQVRAFNEISSHLTTPFLSSQLDTLRLHQIYALHPVRLCCSGFVIKWGGVQNAREGFTLSLVRISIQEMLLPIEVSNMHEDDSFN